MQWLLEYNMFSKKSFVVHDAIFSYLVFAVTVGLYGSHFTP